MQQRRRTGVDHPNLVPASLLPPVDPSISDHPRTGRDWFVDILAFVLSVGIGALILDSSLASSVGGVPHVQTGLDIILGAVACLALWCRRRWPLAVAVLTLVLATFSAFATVAALIALFGLAVHRSARPVVLLALCSVASAVIFAIIRPQTEKIWVVVVTAALVVAATTAWGMFVRARRQLIWTLRERAERAEAEQRQQAERARAGERTRIAREMHDVLAHRISLVALHAGALELRPDLPTDQIRETAGLLRSTARQALEELRDVIGVLREDSTTEGAPAAPQPTLADIPRLVEETRHAGTKIEFELAVEHPDAASSGLGRDAYRIVQEALTNVGKHARGTAARVQVTGAPGAGLLISVRNWMPLQAGTEPVLPGAGAGLLGLQERVTLAGGTLVHGEDGSGQFVVEARLTW